MTWSPGFTDVTPATDLAHDARALVAEHRREQPLAVEPVQRVGVGVADAGRLDLDQHLAILGALQVEFDDFQRPFGLECDGGTGLHSRSIPGSMPA